MTDTVNRCWREIGTDGDRSCPELPRHTHCINCPVYAVAATHFLVRDMPPDYRRHWTRTTSEPVRHDRPRTQSVVAFRIGDEWLGLPTSVFAAVTERGAIHALPHRRGAVLGLATVRGELLICVSLAAVLGIEAQPACPRLMIVETDRGRLAMPVEEVHGIVRYAPEETRELPATTSKADARFANRTIAWEMRAVALLDHGLLFHTINQALA